ncbi:protein FAR1-RELATED SEQUENCE 5-like [Rosa chinensis]|uniref:protein FAR1-RELATED SEQUENCE 5-like n=1 Tax=Rosa chinensis TaxID=74649 RepID=UPI000D08ED15|nr:protein FAR1-RELATED SEQUENCE 5-like [Rosa chinensis]
MEGIGQLMFASLTVPDWESRWQSLILNNGLENNAWVASLYNKRDRWTEAYFRGHLFGGMCSTQRCEGMNCQFKKHISRYTKLSDVMPRLGWKLNRLRDRVMRDNFNIKNSTPLFDTHMRGFEEQACRIFTHDIFIMIKSQIKFEGRFVVHQSFKFPNADSKVFYVRQYDRVERRWCVEYRGNNGNPEWFCSCKMFESDGIPCAHLFCVMKSELVSNFPGCLILKRWTRLVGETTLAPAISVMSNDKSAQSARYAALLIQAAEACLNFSKSPESFNDAMLQLQTFKAKSMEYKEVGEFADTNLPPPTDSPTVVRDPLMSRTKGMSSNRQGHADSQVKRNIITCGRCHEIGHNWRTCKGHQDRFEIIGSGDGQPIETPSVVRQEWEPSIPEFSCAGSDHISSPSSTGLPTNYSQPTTAQPKICISNQLKDCMWPDMEFPLL